MSQQCQRCDRDSHACRVSVATNSVTLRASFYSDCTGRPIKSANRPLAVTGSYNLNYNVSYNVRTPIGLDAPDRPIRHPI